jgi:nicotinate-nucleotide adenylyltransferase
MKIGLYFGSFNPIHIGHLIIASYIANSTDVQKIWFVVSPQNPHKPSSSLLNEYQRLHLVNLAIEGDDRFKASNIEFTLPKPSYTIDTLAYLQEKYPNYEFDIIIGSDSINNLHNWKNYEQLIKNYSFLVYERPGFFPNFSTEIKATLIKAPMLDISSTQIRNYIKSSKSISYLTTKAVEEEIIRYGYYK